MDWASALESEKARRMTGSVAGRGRGCGGGSCAEGFVVSSLIVGDEV